MGDRKVQWHPGFVAALLLEGGEEMSGALLELMEPVIQREVDKEREQWISQGIRGTVSILRNMKIDDHEIKSGIMEQYHLSEKAAEEYLRS